MVALGVIGIVPSSGIFLLIVFIALFDLVFYGQFFMPSLVFYVADTQGLTRQWLNTKKTLPWYAIDWIYGARKTTSYRTYGVKTGQSHEESLMVEAGATRSMKITLRAWLVGGDPNPLLTAIEGRASNALVGFDKMPIVEQRRAAGVLPGAR